MKIDTGVMIEAMANKCCSSRQLAELTGISENTIYRIKDEIHNPRIDTIGKIAKALDIPVNTLIMRE